MQKASRRRGRRSSYAEPEKDERGEGEGETVLAVDGEVERSGCSRTESVEDDVVDEEQGGVRKKETGMQGVSKGTEAQQSPYRESLPEVHRESLLSP